VVVGLALPLVLDGWHGMTRERSFVSAAGRVVPPPRQDGVWGLQPAPQESGVARPDLRQHAVARAAALGYRVGPPSDQGLARAPLLVALADGSAVLILERRGGLVRIFDPALGEGVTTLDRVQARGVTGTQQLLPRASPPAGGP